MSTENNTSSFFVLLLSLDIKLMTTYKKTPSYKIFLYPSKRSKIDHRCYIILLLWRYNSERILAFSTISFHLEWSCTCSAHFTSFIFFKSSLTSSHPAGLPVNGFHLCFLFTMLVSGILFVCPNQLNHWALT